MTGWAGWCWHNSGTTTSKLKFRLFSKRRLQMLFVHFFSFDRIRLSLFQVNCTNAFEVRGGGFQANWAPSVFCRQIGPRKIVAANWAPENFYPCKLSPADWAQEFLLAANWAPANCAPGVFACKKLYSQVFNAQIQLYKYTEGSPQNIFTGLFGNFPQMSDPPYL